MIDRIEAMLRGMLSDSSVSVRLAASASLDRLKAKRSVSSYLEKLRTGALGERVRVVFAAREIGGAEGVSVLVAALADKDEEVRGAAARALGDSLTEPVLQAMAARLPLERGVVLANLLEALGRSGRRDFAPVVEPYLRHPDAEARAAAVQAFARVAGDAGWEKVLAHTAEKDETVRVAAARALGEWTSG